MAAHIKIGIERPTFIELDDRDLFTYLVRSLRCNPLLDENFISDYKVKRGDDGELHLYKVHGDQLSYYDDRGELYLTLVKLGKEIFPNWESRNFREEK